MLAAVLVIIAGIAAYSLLYPKSVSAVEVCRGEVTDTYTITGVYGKDSERIVFSEVDGQVLDVLVTVNDSVKKGDVIAVLSDSALQSEKASIEADKASADADKILAAQDDAIKKTEYASEIAELTAQRDSLEQQCRQALMTSGTPGEQMRQMDYTMDTLRTQSSNYKKSYDTYKSQYEYFSKEAEKLQTQLTTLEAAVHRDEEAIAKAKEALATAKVQVGSNKTAMDEMKSSIVDAENQKDQTYYAWKNARDVAMTVIGTSDEEAFDYSTVDAYYRWYIVQDFESQQKALDVKINYLNAMAKLDTLSPAMAKLDASAGAVEASLDYVDERIESCTIKSPCDGVVTSLPISKTNYLTAGAEAAGITPSGGQCIVCDVLTDYADGIKEGDVATISYKKGGVAQSCEGTVESIFDYATEGTSSLGMNEYRVRVLVAPAEGSDLRSGANADVTFTTYTNANAQYVPVSSLGTENGDYFVYRINGTSLEKVSVQIGYRSNEVAEILSGLNDGDCIARNASMDEIDNKNRVKAVFD